MTFGVEIPDPSELTVTTPGSPWTFCWDDYLDRVRRVLRDDQKEFITDQEIMDDVNEARLELAWRYRAIKSTALGTNSTDTITSTVIGTLNMFEPEVLRITPSDGTNAFEVEFVADDVWFSYKDTGNIPKNTIGRYRNLSIQVYPVPSGTWAWTLDYIAKPAILTEGDCDTLPDVLQRKAVAYARAQMKKKLNEVIEAEMYDGQYQEGMPQGDVNQLYTSRGPIQLIPSFGNAFDADPEAAHR